MFAPIEASGRSRKFESSEPLSAAVQNSVETFNMTNALAIMKNGSAGSTNGLLLQSSSTEFGMQPSIDQNEPAEKVPFRYNPLHDLESLWWIAVYFVFKQGIDIDTPDPEVKQERERIVNPLFNEERVECLSNETCLVKALNVLPVVLRPAGRALTDARRYLVENFRMAEAQVGIPSVPHKLADGLHNRLGYFFTAIHHSVANIHINPVRMVRGNIELASSPPIPQASSSRKRARSDDTESTDLGTTKRRRKARR